MRSCRAILVALTMAATMAFGPACAAEAYQPDPKLVEAARKEGEVALVHDADRRSDRAAADQGVPAQIPGIDVKFVRIDSAQQVMRLINEARVGRTQADVWHVIDGVAPLAAGERRGADSILPSAARPAGDADRSATGTGSPPISPPARSPTTPSWSPPEQVPRTHQDLLDPRWKGAVRLASERHDRRLGLHRHRAASHGRGARHALSAQARQAGDRAAAGRHPRRARPRHRRRISDGPRNEQLARRHQRRASARRCAGCRSTPSP